MGKARKIRTYLVIFGALLLLTFAIYQSRRMKNLGKTYYKIFNNSKLEGKIVRINSSLGLSHIKLDNMDSEFSFMPFAVKSNKDRIFYITAKVGDSILKMPFSDTLQLTHTGLKYYYTFTKFK